MRLLGFGNGALTVYGVEVVLTFPTSRFTLLFRKIFENAHLFSTP
jgi:hypothetical protein